MKKVAWVLLVLGCMSSVFAETLLKAPLVAGYCQARRLVNEMPPEKIDCRYDVLFHAFFVADVADGKVMVKAAGNLPSADIVHRSQERGQKVLLSLGGGGVKSFKALTATDALCRDYVKAVMAHVQSRGYDGVDLDWEHPVSKADAGRWDVLTAELRRALDAYGREVGRKLYLTTALAPGEWCWRHLDYRALGRNLDFVFMMCYDGAWGQVAYHASVDMQKDLAHFSEKTGYPRDRVIVGMPFYGTRIVTDKAYGPTSNRTQMLYRDIPAAVRAHGVFDEKTMGMSAWVREDGRKVLYWFDAPRSIADKTAVSLKNGFGGVFCWAVGQDLLQDGSQPLGDAMCGAIKPSFRMAPVTP